MAAVYQPPAEKATKRRSDSMPAARWWVASTGSARLTDGCAPVDRRDERADAEARARRYCTIFHTLPLAGFGMWLFFCFGAGRFGSGLTPMRTYSTTGL